VAESYDQEWMAFDGSKQVIVQNRR
jgi:hypothetical protein